MQQAQDFMKSVFENFTVELFDERVCTEWILNKLHPEGASCPRCFKPISSVKCLQNFWGLKRVFCKDCKKIFTSLTGTFLNGIQMDLRALFIMAIFLQLDVNKKTIAKLLKIHPETVRFWETKFRVWEAMAKENTTNGAEANKSL
jgi:transposase-like protein